MSCFLILFPTFNDGKWLNVPALSNCRRCPKGKSLLCGTFPLSHCVPLPDCHCALHHVVASNIGSRNRDRNQVSQFCAVRVPPSLLFFLFEPPEEIDYSLRLVAAASLPRPWLPDDVSQIFRLLEFGPSRLEGSATLHCKIVSLPFLGLRQGERAAGWTTY